MNADYRKINEVLGMIEGLDIAHAIEIFNSVALVIESHDEYDTLDDETQSLISDTVAQTNDWLDNNAGDYIADSETARNEHTLNDMLRDDE